MAFVDNTTYTAEHEMVGEFWQKALLGSEVLNEVFTIMPGVKNSIKLAQWDLGDGIIQDADCSFSNDGEGALSEKTFSVADKKVNLEYCIKTFEQNYLHKILQDGSNNTESQDINSFLIESSALKVADGVVKYAFSADSTGLVGKFLADAGVVDVTINALSATNALDEIAKVYLAIPAEIINKEDLFIGISEDAARYFKLAAFDTTVPELTINEGLQLRYLGIPMIICDGMGANTLFAARKSNLLYLTDLESDSEDLQVINMRETTGEPKVRFVTDFKMSFDFMIPEEIVLAQTA